MTKVELKKWILVSFGALLLSFTPTHCNAIEKDTINTRLNDSVLYNYLVDNNVKQPEIVLTQAKLESANYSSKLYQNKNNLFGMKVAKNRETTGCGRKGYQKYECWKDSVRDYIIWQEKIKFLNKDQYLLYLSKHYSKDANYKNKIKSMMKKIDFKKIKR